VPKPTASLPVAVFALATLLTAGLLAGSAAPATAVTTSTWTYDQGSRQLVGASGSLPFSIQGGTTNYMFATPGIRFTASPSLATYTGSTFLAPGTADFTYRAVLAVDAVRKSSSANVFQYGAYNVHQVKLQLTTTGVPMCVLNGSGGRVKITSSHASLVDGAQHTMSCWRRGPTVGVTVDGVSSSQGFNLGSVVPTGKATAGNKPGGGAADQLFGTIWQVAVDIG
jgi:hypothetical protein